MPDVGRVRLAALFVMWAVMMVAMMLPSAAPIILLVLGVYRRRGTATSRAPDGGIRRRISVRVDGFSAAAALLQIGFCTARRCCRRDMVQPFGGVRGASS